MQNFQRNQQESPEPWIFHTFKLSREAFEED